MNKKKETGIILLAYMWLAVLASGGSVWREASHQEFSDGRFSDSGANAYVSAAGRIQLANRWDYNGDGYIDIMMVNSHPLLEMLDMSIYWGNGKDFSIRDHDYVPANGPMWVSPADLDLDGRMDLAVANYSNGTWTSMDSAIYWGNDGSGDKGDWTSGPFRGKTMLPSRNAQGVVAADLNGDGYPEVIYAMSAGFWEYRGTSGVPGSRIYWNRKGTFSSDDFAVLQTLGASDVDVADVNGDGMPDLAFSCGEGEESFLYFGSQSGYSEENRISLPTSGAHAVQLEDIDGDGDPDLLFANQVGPYSVAYLNKNGKFSPGSLQKFPTHYAKDVVVEDFNNDGSPDVFFTNHMYAEKGKERFGSRMTYSYLYFGDKGNFSETRRQELQGIGAWGANAADLNKDGWIDLLVCNFQEHYSYEVPSFVYWNGPEGFLTTRRTPLYEHGAQGNAIADFNGDGHLDILITSMMGRSRGDYDPTYLYPGNKDGLYSVDNRIDLPGREPYEQAMSDLDDDGQVDVVLLNQGEVTRYENEAFIYWNTDNKLDPWNVTGIPAHAGVGLEVTDLDKDGYLDIIISNNKPHYPDATGSSVANVDKAIGSFIYWGSENGYVISERSTLPVFKCRSPSIADLNGDGHLDLVFAGNDPRIFWGDGNRNYTEQQSQPIEGTTSPNNHQTEVADLNKDGWLDIIFAGDKGAEVLIYWGDADSRYEESNRMKLKTGAKTMTIADVDMDGWLDLVCPIYKVGGTRTLESSVFLGGPDGYNADRRIELLTDGATGSIVSDFNFDGYNDLFFFCHRTDGDSGEVGIYADHKTDSRLYWGSKNGFSEDNYLRIPSVGVHYDIGMDMGLINDRSFVWEYSSSPHNAGNSVWKRISWEAEMPGATSVRFQVRAASSQKDLLNAEWQGPDGPGSYFTKSGASLPKNQAGKWIQYKLLLDTFNGAASPVVSAVEIDFQ